MKSLFKLCAVLVLAVFQLSFFLNPQTTKKIHRDLAQSDEVATDEPARTNDGIRIDGRYVDPSFLEEEEGDDTPVFTDEGEEEVATPVEDTGGFTDLIPENMPPAEDVRQALINYNTKKEQCLVREEDRSRMTSLMRRYNEARSSGSSEDKALAFYEVASKLVDLGLLDHEFERPASASDSDDSRYDLDIEDLETATTRSGSGLLDLSVQSDLEQFQQCHVAIMRDRNMTEAEQEAYFKNTVEPIMHEMLRDGIASNPGTIRDANNWYAVAEEADAVTGNKLGLEYGAQAHGQAAIAISAQLAEITRLQNILKVNPSDQATRTLLATKFTEIEASLRGISTNLKAQAATAFAADPAALASAQANIDFAIGYWAQETIKIAEGQPSTSLTAYSGSTTPSVTNPIGAITSGVTPTIFTDSYLNGSTVPTANLDPNNAMLLPPTATLNGTPGATVALTSGIRNSDALQRGSDAPEGFRPVTTNRPVRQ